MCILVDVADTQSSWLPGSALCGCCQLLVGRARQLPAEPWVVLGLGLAHWWAELGSGVGGFGTWYPGSSVCCWWVGPVPDTADYRVWSTPEFMLACW